MMRSASDFSFAERVVIDIWVWLWFIHRVWSTDNFASLRWSKIRNFDLKSVITLLILIMLPVQAIFDLVWTYIKYEEGYMFDPDTSQIIPKPAYTIIGNEKIPLWSKKNLLLKVITEYLLTFGFAFQIGTLALMQAFWSHLSSQMGGKPFMRTWKFRFYIGWVFVSIIIFPITRVLISSNVNLVENIPSLVYSVQLFFIFLLGIKNGMRLNNLLESIQQTSSPTGYETILRIHYFIAMNKSLMFGALLMSVGFSVINLDAITFNHYMKSKFLMDLSLIHANFGSLILWSTMILIIYPRYYITGSSGVPESITESTFSPSKNRLSVSTIGSKTKSIIFNIKRTSQQKKSKTVKGSFDNNKIGKSVASLLEEQQKQFEIFRDKASNSIFSDSSFLIISKPPKPPLTPPPMFVISEDPLHDV